MVDEVQCKARQVTPDRIVGRSRTFWVVDCGLLLARAGKRRLAERCCIGRSVGRDGGPRRASAPRFRSIGRVVRSEEAFELHKIYLSSTGKCTSLGILFGTLGTQTCEEGSVWRSLKREVCILKMTTYLAQTMLLLGVTGTGGRHYVTWAPPR